MGRVGSRPPGSPYFEALEGSCGGEWKASF
jgi:hypothetical protein